MESNNNKYSDLEKPSAGSSQNFNYQLDETFDSLPT